MSDTCAYHEAGHAVMAAYLGAKIASLTIDPDWDDLPRRDGDIEVHWDLTQLTHRQLCERSILVALAGPVAEMIHTGNPFHPALAKEWSSDWSTAWNLAAALQVADRPRLAYLEQSTRQVYQQLSQDEIWNALAALVDELSTHETMDGPWVHEVLSHWM